MELCLSAQLFINGTLYVKDHLLDRSNNHSMTGLMMVINSQMSTAQNTVRELLTSDHSVGTYGWNMFPEIRRCNLIIEKVAASTTIEENQKIILLHRVSSRAMLLQYGKKIYG